MAWSFSEEIHALTGFDAASSSTTETGETHRTMTAQWLKDAAKDIINMLPPNLLKLCTSMQAFGADSKVPGSEAEVLNTGKILSVFAGDYEARQISSNFKYKANEPDNIEYATVSDPVYYIEGNKINILPSGLTNTTLKYEEVQYPTISFDDTAIASFPDEAERLVVLKAAITAAEYMLMTEEDPEIFLPMIQNLKQDLNQGLQAIGVQMAQPQQAGR